ncbi:unnamed protein product [Adineta ricciae]|uniref:Syndecan n=1 Tax=Adineta ricciae TaxID=249248 RepID=A0A814F4N3_ADIRI|nr:unnamed protein product [Adineta ricciae]
MFIRLLVTSSFLVLIVQSAATNSSKGQTADALTLPKQGSSLYDDYDLNDPKLLGTNVEGSGGAASLDEYADDEEEEQLSKVTANSSTTTTTIIMITTRLTTTSRTTSSSSSSTTTTTTTTTVRPTTTTTGVNRWSKTTSSNYEPTRRKPQSSTTSSTPVFNDLDGNEFKDEHEDYTDDLEDDAYYNEPTVSNRVPTTTTIHTSRYPGLTTRQTTVGNHTTPLWILFSFLTRPPIAAGILAGLAIGILTSIILLACIIRRYHTREKSHTSYTTGLLYPNQYGYSKSPQEFYA